VKKQLGPTDSMFPVPAALIVSGENKDANIITIARIGIPSPTPPTIGISVKKSRYGNRYFKNKSACLLCKST
jgi:flavin reductase (DIM6/NTAB) family NADH-FMN oxidoreductase RutF